LVNWDWQSAIIDKLGDAQLWSLYVIVFIVPITSTDNAPGNYVTQITLNYFSHACVHDTLARSGAISTSFLLPRNKCHSCFSDRRIKQTRRQQRCDQFWSEFLCTQHYLFSLQTAGTVFQQLLRYLWVHTMNLLRRWFLKGLPECWKWFIWRHNKARYWFPSQHL